MIFPQEFFSRAFFSETAGSTGIRWRIGRLSSSSFLPVSRIVDSQQVDEERDRGKGKTKERRYDMFTMFFFVFLFVLFFYQRAATTTENLTHKRHLKSFDGNEKEYIDLFWCIFLIYIIYTVPTLRYHLIANVSIEIRKESSSYLAGCLFKKKTKQTRKIIWAAVNCPVCFLITFG